ncbi:carboxylesterase/lipase family protein [Agromyces sp. NPDC056523]|uniref:carboxylesterase/lipase family protein n=1 Tax=Agromyces sp. NPDC056523 TaxID=3345850 RepID=UPI00367008CC
MTLTEPDTHVEVDTRSGRVRGRWRGTPGSPGASAAFLGIPFAEAPVRSRRFAAPVPVVPWEGVRDSLAFGATAQRGDPGVTLIPEPSVPGESTLNVNVFTPRPAAAAAGSGLPVLVWIHGGGYVAGSPASPWYDGRGFNGDGVVTVSVSYRLGFDGFGWIADAPANRGVLDWLCALEWMRDHVAAFGGDPARVTIAGQSAGGGAVLTLLGMPRAQGLFHRAWAVSPATADIPAARAEAVGRRLAALGGVEPTRAGLGELRESRVHELQEQATRGDGAAHGLRSMLVDGLQWGPVVDGDLVPRPTRDSFAAGVGAGVPLVLGATDDEFSMAFRDRAARLRWTPPSLVLGRMGLDGSERRTWLRANRDVQRRGTAAVLGRYVTDRIFRAPVVATVVARATGASARAGSVDASAPAGTWAYRFTWRSPEHDFAVHCLDVPFLFDCLGDEHVERLAGSTPPQELADAVHCAAAAFVRGENPSWPRATGPEVIARVFDVPVSTLEDAYASALPLATPPSVE